METLRLSEIIGKEISDICCHYIAENEFGLQSFHAFLKLSDGTIIYIPKFDDEVYLHLTSENIEYLKTRFETGESIDKKLRKSIIGQKITDLFFCYYNNEVDVDFSAFVKLSNNMYLSEKNFGPVGLTDIGLILMNACDFNLKKQRLSEINVVFKKFEY